MSIAGNLVTMDLAELLQWLSQSRKTGTLVINNGKVEKRLFLREGRIVSSASSDPKEYLGHFLVSQNLINEGQLDAAIAQQASKKMLLGEILVTEGAVKEEDLNRVLRLKAEEGIYDIFTWENGEFRFLQGELPDRKFTPLSLDLTAILMEGARRVDEWSRIRDTIQDFNAIPVSVTELSEPEAPPAAQKVLALVNDERTVEEIQEESHATAFYVCSVLWEQVQKKTIKVVQPRVVEVKVEVPVPQSAPVPQQQGHQHPQQQAPPQQAAPPPQQPPPQYQQPPQQGYGGGYGGNPGTHPGVHMPPGGGGLGGASAAQAPPVEALDDADPSTLDPNTLLAAASQNIVQREFDRAMRYLRAVRTIRPGDRELDGAVHSAEQQIKAAIARSGLSMDKVPKLAVSMDQLTTLNVSSQEGYILTRIDGSYDLKSLLKISPMPEIDALILFNRLFKAGHIKI